MISRDCEKSLFLLYFKVGGPSSSIVALSTWVKGRQNTLGMGGPGGGGWVKASVRRSTPDVPSVVCSSGPNMTAQRFKQ